MTDDIQDDAPRAPKRTHVEPERDPLLEDDKPSFQFKLPRFVLPALGTVVGLFVLLFLIGLAVPLFVDFKAMRDKVLAEVEQSTGFKVTLSDQIDFTLMPFPKVGVHDVTVRHRLDDPSSPLLKAQDVTVSVGLDSLFSGRVDITKVEVDGAQVNLRELASGTNNWTPATQEVKETTVDKVADTENVPPAQVLGGEATADAIKSNAPEAKGPAVSLDQIELHDTQIVYTPLSGNPSDIRVADGSVGLSEFDGPFDVTIKGDAMKGRLPIDLSASLGKLTGTTDPSALTLDFKTDAGTIKLDGDVTLGAAPNYQGKADIDLSDVTKLMQALDPKAAGAPIKQFALKGNVEASAQSVHIKDADVKLDEAHGPLNLALEGMGGETLSGTVNTKLDVKNWALAKGFKEVALQGQFAKQGEVTRVAPLDLSIDGQRVTGAAASGPGGTTINLQSDKLDLTPLLAAFGIKDLPIGVLNGVALNAAMAGPGATINSLTIADVNGLKVAATGSVADLAKGSGVKADVTVNSQNLLKSLKQFPQVTIPKEAETYLDQAGSAKASYAGTMDAGNVVASIQAMGGSAGVKTSLTDIKTALKTGALTFTLAHPNANAFLGMVSPGTKMGPAFNGPLNVEAGVVQNGESITVNNLNAKVGGTTLAGNLAIKTGTVPFITGSLQTGAIDVAQWFGGKETNAKTSLRQDGQSPLLVMAATGGGGKFSSTPLDLTWMSKMGLDLALNASQITSDPWTIAKPSLKLKLSDGNLTISDLTGGFLGGTIKADLSADNTNGSLAVKGKANAASIQLDPLTRALVKTGKVVEGVGDMDISLTTSGASANALVNGLNGSGTVKGTNLVIYGLNVDSIVDTLYAVEEDDWTSAAKLVTSNFRDGSSRFSDATIPLTVTNGVASWPETTLKSNRTDVLTKGTLNFPAWTVDVQNRVVVNTQEGRKIDAIQIATTGSLDNPQTKTDSSALSDKLKGRAAKLIDKKVPDQFKGLVGGLLGVPQEEKAAAPATTTTAPAATTTSDPAPTAATTTAPAASDTAPATIPGTNVAPAPVEPVPATEAAPAESSSEQKIEGVLDNVLGQ